MRILLNCMQCFKEKGSPSDLFYFAVVQDNGLYRMKCEYGHQTITCLQQQKFEVLFELAANAVIDGYYRESVSSFTASFERFMELYLCVIRLKCGVPDDKFLNAWNTIAAQSERQLGAYVFVYLMENGEPPPLLKPKLVTFRNDVIHKGRIPTREQAVEYGQSVLEIIAPILHDLKERYVEHVSTVVRQHVIETRAHIEEPQHVSFMSIATIISISRAATEPQRTLAQALAHLTESRRKLGLQSLG